MIPKGASGAEAEIPINLFDSSGNAVLAHIWVSGELKWNLPGSGTAMVAVPITAGQILEKGLGRYAIQLTAGQSATAGSVYVVLDTVAFPAYSPYSWQDVILDIGKWMLTFSHRTGRTLLGLMRRLDAFAVNAATHLDGGNAQFMQPDGVTPEYQTTHDGFSTRSAAIVTNSEIP